MDADRRPLREYIDSTVFLGLHALEEPVRRACKALLCARLSSTLYMTYEHVGRCDDVIWGYSRALQDRYYPFMDALHSLPCLRREGHDASTLCLAAFDDRLQDLPVFQRLLVGRALERQARVYTLDPALLERADLPVQAPPMVNAEVAFPAGLEALYRVSLQLRVPLLSGAATSDAASADMAFQKEVVSCMAG